MIFLKLIFNLLIFSCIYTKIEAKCPVKKISYPCVCEESEITSIKCKGNQRIDLKKILTEFSKNLDEKDKHFKVFDLNNQAIEVIEDNIFDDLTFDYVFFNNCSKLRQIKSNAFNSSGSLGINVLELRYDSLISDEYSGELFNSLSYLKNIEWIDLYTRNITRIPKNAFKDVNGRQTKLKQIGIYSKNEKLFKAIKSIEDNPFYYLNNLTDIHLFGNELDSISKQAFDFELSSENKLNIGLENNHLNDSSLAVGLFLNSKRPLSIDLSHNRLTLLKEEVFSPVLLSNHNNSIDLTGNQLICDCRIYWLIKSKDKFQNQISGAVCNDGKKLFEKDFKNCEHF